jgi:hypothetical protein
MTDWTIREWPNRTGGNEDTSAFITGTSEGFMDYGEAWSYIGGNVAPGDTVTVLEPDPTGMDRESEYEFEDGLEFGVSTHENIGETQVVWITEGVDAVGRTRDLRRETKFFPTQQLANDEGHKIMHANRGKIKKIWLQGRKKNWDGSLAD